MNNYVITVNVYSILIHSVLRIISMDIGIRLSGSTFLLSYIYTGAFFGKIVKKSENK